MFFWRVRLRPPKCIKKLLVKQDEGEREADIQLFLLPLSKSLIRTFDLSNLVTANAFERRPRDFCHVWRKWIAQKFTWTKMLLIWSDFRVRVKPLWAQPSDKRLRHWRVIYYSINYLQWLIGKITSVPFFISSMSFERVSASASYLLERTEHRPRIAVICGSGLGQGSQLYLGLPEKTYGVISTLTLAAGLADLLQDPDVFPYEDIPQFPQGGDSINMFKKWNNVAKKMITAISLDVLQADVRKKFTKYRGRHFPIDAQTSCLNGTYRARSRDTNRGFCLESCEESAWCWCRAGSTTTRDTRWEKWA